MVVRVVSFHGFVHLVVVHVTVAKGDAFASTPVVKLGLFGRCLKDVAMFIVAAKCCSMAWFSWWAAVGSGFDTGRVGFFFTLFFFLLLGYNSISGLYSPGARVASAQWRIGDAPLSQATGLAPQ